MNGFSIPYLTLSKSGQREEKFTTVPIIVRKALDNSKDKNVHNVHQAMVCADDRTNILKCMFVSLPATSPGRPLSYIHLLD